jgi:hypothetical protein
MGYRRVILEQSRDQKQPDEMHMPDAMAALARARHFMATGEDEAAKAAYVDVLRIDPTNVAALNEIGVLALRGGHRSAARTAWLQAIRFHPAAHAAHVNLANLLMEDGDTAGARPHYEAALSAASDSPEAHQGLARVLTETGDADAEHHRRKGFRGHATVNRPYRGTGPAVPILLLVSGRGGNIPAQHWIDDRSFAITALYADFYDLEQPLPPHVLAVNLIGDADLCGHALECAERLLRNSPAPPINPPAQVRVTGRAANARRLGALPGVITPKTDVWTRARLLVAGDLVFPLLLRVPGFHTGRHFHYVEDRNSLIRIAGTLAHDELLTIQYLDARGPDGMARKYRVMFIGGALYPMHLAISAEWKVHYFTAAMARNAAFREEERRFLDNMPAVLGPRAMTALTAIGEALGLDYAGADFALTPDGSVLLFEANATMVVNQPDPDPMWDYRRGAIAAVLEAGRRLLFRRATIRDTVGALT